MTPNALDVYSEPYGSTGNIGENFQRLLGAPTLNRLQTVIREAVQNIADAAIPGIGPEIEIRLRRLTPRQQKILASRVLRDLPKGPRSRKQIRALRSQADLVVMEICDFQTSGLGGPPRADRIPLGTTDTDFIDFLRNIGTGRDTEQGGGTYGFGKVALYSASKCSTIIVDTLPCGRGPRERRLIGCHVGQSFDLAEDGMSRQYTGRHWWGVADPTDGIVDPITGDAATRLASELGFPQRGENRSGTSIMILDFDTNDEDLNLLGQRVVEGLLWNFWPRMLRDTPTDKLFTCKVEVNGSAIPIPSPEDFPPLDLFSKAMRAIRNESGNDLRSISSQRPRKRLGTLAIEKGLRARRHRLVHEGSMFPEASRHIALMRPIELVVKYLEGQALPDKRLEWAGVFVTSHEDEVERAFAYSEPPAHDDWIPDNFPRGNRKRYVNIALKRLKHAASEMGEIAHGHSGDVDASSPLGRLGARLGSVLEGVGGDGAGKRPKNGPGRRPRPRRAKATRPTFERLETSREGTVAVFSTDVSQDADRTGATLVAQPAVAVEGSKVSRTENDIEQPLVLAIRTRDGNRSVNGGRLDLSGQEGTFEISILVRGDCAVTVDAHVLSRAQQ